MFAHGWNVTQNYLNNRKTEVIAGSFIANSNCVCRQGYWEIWHEGVARRVKNGQFNCFLCVKWSISVSVSVCLLDLKVNIRRHGLFFLCIHLFYALLKALWSATVVLLMCCPDQPEQENVFGWYFLIMGTNCFRYYILFWKELEQFQCKCTWFQLLWAFASQCKYCDPWTPASEWQHFTNLVCYGRKSNFGVPSQAHMLPCGCCLYIWCFTEGSDAHGLASTFVYMWKVTMLLGISITSACLTYPRLWGRCICWVPLCCGCCAGVEAPVQTAHSLSCSGGTVLVWEDQSVSGLNDATRPWRCGCHLSSSNYNAASNFELVVLTNVPRDRVARQRQQSLGYNDLMAPAAAELGTDDDPVGPR